MSGAAGYIVVLSEARTEVFEHQRWIGPLFAEAVPEFQHSHTAALICFISTKRGWITHVAQGTRGVRAGTGQRRLNLTDILPVKKPIATKDIKKQVGARVRRHVADRLTKGGMLPPKSLEEFVDVVIGLAPSLRAILIKYGSERKARIRQLSEGARRSLGAQKEAVNSALYIAELNRRPLLNWTPTGAAAPKSFVEGLPEARLLEDSMVWHDMLEGLPGLDLVKRAITGVAKFESDFLTLEVMVANRTALEHQTGADLIYFNATFNSFVLVQYKAMERPSGTQESLFRLPNTQLADEIKRMDATHSSLRGARPSSHRHDYRLNENPFFLKLCPRVVFNPDNVGLTPGMYMPLDYWRFVESDSDLVGKRGGRIVTYQNIGRYLDNSEFAAIVRGAWIGTTPSQSALLGPVIEELLREGKAVVVAVKTDKKTNKPQTGNDGVDDIESAGEIV
jgi:hypothetical protein